MMIVLINRQKYKSISYRIGRMITEQFPESKISKFFSREAEKPIDQRKIRKKDKGGDIHV